MGYIMRNSRDPLMARGCGIPEERQKNVRLRCLPSPFMRWAERDNGIIPSLSLSKRRRPQWLQVVLNLDGIRS
ncbi:hypothetical protein NPIL_570601 [Nephila pilipes]|uniref:Uncharacterized protein n=1 Tax=Nephila pilipes TaxID=299642 RepID=A0A8X6NRW7_NEPPI|nr:hypothetical protein NPIL_570601 [Nephila pilipes]